MKVKNEVVVVNKDYYQIENKLYYRVSTILSLLTTKKYGSINRKALERYAAAGTHIHKLLEQLMIGDGYMEYIIDDFHKSVATSFIGWMKKKDITSFNTESVYYGEIKGINVAGTIDLICKTKDNKVWIIDYKTRTLKPTMELLTESLQLMLYQKLTKIRNANLAIVFVDRKTGDIVEYQLSPSPTLNKLLNKLLELMEVYLVNNKLSVRLGER